MGKRRKITHIAVTTVGTYRKCQNRFGYNPQTVVRWGQRMKLECGHLAIRAGLKKEVGMNIICHECDPADELSNDQY